MDISNLLLNEAILIAVKAHSGQKDKAGEPYILHPLRVMLSQKNNVNRIVAVLHDVIEDAGYDYRQYLIDTGFSEEVMNALDCLTHKNDENYFDYIRCCKNNDIARFVKLADLEDNMDLKRIDKPIDKDYERNIKYHKASSILLGLSE